MRGLIWNFYSGVKGVTIMAAEKKATATKKDIVINDTNDIKSVDKIQDAINEALEREKNNK